MKVVWFLALTAAMVAAILVVAGQMGFLMGKAPKDLGVREARLKRPSKTPNSVSSQAALHPDHPQREYADIAAFTFSGDGTAAINRIADILRNMPRTVVVTQESDYLYAQCTTSLLKFTDDVEFWLDRSAGAIQVRSASRVGRKDFNVNRARIEAIRTQFEKKLSSDALRLP